jgi:phospholipase C
VVSPYVKRGHVSHNYSDHEFIEHNWNLPTISDRSRDNLPDPWVDGDDPYVPKNRPAISDLFDLFDFNHCDDE